MWIEDQAGGGEAVLSKLLGSECISAWGVWCSVYTGGKNVWCDIISAILPYEILPFNFDLKFCWNWSFFHYEKIMRFKKSPQLPGAGRTWAGHHHGSHTPTSTGAILLSKMGKMACQPKHFGCQCTNKKDAIKKWKVHIQWNTWKQEIDNPLDNPQCYH